FKQVELIDVTLEIEISGRDNAALMQEAKILNETINPGDTLVIQVTLLPYRSEPVVKNIAFKLPEDINPGLATLVIDGGLTGISYQALPEDGYDYALEETKEAITEGYKDLESILEDFLERPRNNELILQIYPAYAAPEQEMEEVGEEGEEKQRRENGIVDGATEDEEESQ